jgi:uncharacterized membrane protein
MSHKKNHHTPIPEETHHKHHHDIFENRKQFQLERLMLFSDAVFAIAITLLILEIKLPESFHHSQTYKDVLRSLCEIQGKFIGFLSSFFLIGIYWMVHHRMYQYIINYNNKLIWLNLLILLFVVLLPFTTGLAFEMVTPDFDVVFFIYGFNHFMISFIYYRMWCYIGNPKRNLSTGLDDQKHLKYYKWRSLAPIFIFALVMLACFGHPIIARLCPMLIPIEIIIINRVFGYKK